jgi:hypothetical protein
MSYSRIFLRIRLTTSLPDPSRIRRTMCGGNRIRTCEEVNQQIYSLSQLAALVFPQLISDPLIRRSMNLFKSKILGFNKMRTLKLFSPYWQKTGVQNYTVLHFFKTSGVKIGGI